MGAKVKYTVFSKPWKELSLPDLAKKVSSLGFDGIELPVRPEFQVEPDKIKTDLPEAVKILGDHGVSIGSIAYAVGLPLTDTVIEACAAANIKVIREIIFTDDGQSYMGIMAETIERYKGLVPALDANGVTIGVQNHCHREISSVMGIRYLFETFDPKHVACVLDVGHCGLGMELPDLVFDILKGYICMVNFKNAFWKRTNGPEADAAEWAVHWTTGEHGMANWKDFVDELHKMNYEGFVCFPAEFSDQGAVEKLLARDVQYLKGLFAS